MKNWIIPSLFLLLLTACGNEDPPDNTGETETEESEQQNGPTTEIATGLETPWSINKNGNEFYISERPGSVAYIDADGELIRQQVEFSDTLSTAAEAGFIGFVLKPDFSESNEAYAYYVYERNGESYNKITTLALENDMWRETDVLLDAIQTGNVHHGGRLVLDDDGELFATVGDASNADLAQDPNSVNGKILKLNADGEFEIYSMGHRNPQGIAWNGDTMYASEHGQSANDEINIIEEGNNYGWPIIEGDQNGDGLESPFVTSGENETWAPSGIAVHDDLLYAAALAGAAIKVIDPESGEVTDSIEGFGRVRDIISDGNDLYFITNNTDGRGNPEEDDDKLYRMSTQ